MLLAAVNGKEKRTSTIRVQPTFKPPILGDDGKSSREVKEFFEKFDIELPETLRPGMTVSVKTETGKQFSVIMRFDTDLELTYYRHGGILNYMVRKVASKNQ